MARTKAPKRTCQQALEERGVKVFPTVEDEFVAYKPVKDGVADMDFDMEDLLETLGFCDYEEIAMGRAFYVMGDVTQPV